MHDQGPRNMVWSGGGGVKAPPSPSPCAVPDDEMCFLLLVLFFSRIKVVRSQRKHQK